MAPNWADLDRMTDDELITRYDTAAKSLGSSLSLYRDELMRRELRRSSEAAHRLARTNMVVAIVAAVAALLALLVPFLA